MLKTIGKILWFPGGLGILCWMGVEEGNFLLIIPGLILLPFVLADLFVAWLIDLFGSK